MSRREWVPVFARINTSAKLVALPNDTYRLFFMMLLPQCDGWGRASADPGVLDALVWPRFKWAVDVAGDALAACERVGLVEIHQTEHGERFVQVAGWERKAGRLYNHIKRGQSEWPEPSHKSLLTPESVATSPDLGACSPELGAGSRDKGPRPPLLSSPLTVVRSTAHILPPAAAVSANGAGKEQPGDHTQAIAHWTAEFQRTRGSSYAFRDGRDGAAIKALLFGSSLAEFRLRSTALLESQDPYYRDKGCDLGTLRAAWNKLATPKPATRSYATPAEPEDLMPGADKATRHRVLQEAIARADSKP
jgi:hypothetical protein